MHPGLVYQSGMMTDSKPIQRRKLSDEIQDRLLELIKNADMKPGDVLPSERELMARYGVGRPAIREAMQNLERMGLINIRHGGRPRIAEPSLNQMVGQLGETMRHVLKNSASTMEHLKEARVTFEVQMARMAAENRNPACLDEMHRKLAWQQENKGNPARFMTLDGEFHQAIAAASGNPIFESLSSAIFGWLAEFHTEQVRKPGLENLTLAEHAEILRAIEAGDPDAAGDAMRDHLTRANALYHSASKKPHHG